jgi:hypothetical protein
MPKRGGRDFSGDQDLMAPVLAWLIENQSDVVRNSTA